MNNVNGGLEYEATGHAKPGSESAGQGSDSPRGPLVGYFLRHWRGELSLNDSFWFNVVILGGAGHPILSVLTFFDSAFGPNPHPGYAGFQVVLICALIFVLALWQGVGLRRSALIYIADNDALSWSGSAMLVKD